MVEPFDYRRFFYNPKQAKPLDQQSGPYNYKSLFLPEKKNESLWGEYVIPDEELSVVTPSFDFDNEVMKSIADAQTALMSEQDPLLVRFGKTATFGLLASLDYLFSIAEAPFTALVEAAASAGEAIDESEGFWNKLGAFVAGYLGGVVKTFGRALVANPIRWSEAVEHVMQRIDPEYKMGFAGTVVSEAFNPINWVTFGAANVAKAAMFGGKTIRGIAKIANRITKEQLVNAVTRLEKAGYRIAPEVRKAMLRGEKAEFVEWLSKVEELDKLYATTGLSTLFKRAVKRAVKKTEKILGEKNLAGRPVNEQLYNIIPGANIENAVLDEAKKQLYFYNFIKELEGVFVESKKFRGFVSGVEAVVMESPVFVAEKLLSKIAAQIPIVGKTLEKKIALFGSELTMATKFKERSETLVPVVKFFGVEAENVRPIRYFGPTVIAKYMEEARAKKRSAAQVYEALKEVRKKVEKGIKLTRSEEKLLEKASQVDKYVNAKLEDIAFAIAFAKEPGSPLLNKIYNTIVHKIISKPFVKASTFTEKLAAAEIEHLAQKASSEVQEVQAYFEYMDRHISALAEEYAKTHNVDKDAIEQVMRDTISDIIETRVTERVTTGKVGERFIDSEHTAIEFANKSLSRVENNVEISVPQISKNDENLAVARGALDKESFENLVTGAWAVSGRPVPVDRYKMIIDDAYARYVTYINNANRKASPLTDFVEIAMNRHEVYRTEIHFKITDDSIRKLLGVDVVTARGSVATSAVRGEVSLKDAFIEAASPIFNKNVTKEKLVEFLDSMQVDPVRRHIFESFSDMFFRNKELIIDPELRAIAFQDRLPYKKKVVSHDYIVRGNNPEKRKIPSKRHEVATKTTVKVEKTIEVSAEELTKKTGVKVTKVEITPEKLSANVGAWKLTGKKEADYVAGLQAEMASLGYAVNSLNIEKVGTVSLEDVAERVRAISEDEVANVIDKRLLAGEINKGIYRVVVEGEKGYDFAPIKAIYATAETYGAEVGKNFYSWKKAVIDGKEVNLVFRQVRKGRRTVYDAFVVDPQTWNVLEEESKKLGFSHNMKKAKWETLFHENLKINVDEWRKRGLSTHLKAFAEKTTKRRPIIVVDTGKWMNEITEATVPKTEYEEAVVEAAKTTGKKINVIEGRYVGAVIGYELPEEAMTALPMFGGRRVVSWNGKLHYVEEVAAITPDSIVTVHAPEKYKELHEAVLESVKKKKGKLESFLVLRPISNIEKVNMISEMDSVLDIMHKYVPDISERFRESFHVAIQNNDMDAFIKLHNDMVEAIAEENIAAEVMGEASELMSFYGKEWYFDVLTGEVKTIKGGKIISHEGLKDINEAIKTVAPEVYDRNPDFVKRVVNDYIQLAKSAGEYYYISNESLGELFNIIERSGFDIETFEQLYNVAMDMKKRFMDIHMAQEVAHLQADMLSDDFIDYLARIMTADARDVFIRSGLMEYDAQRNIYKFKSDEIRDKLLYRDAFRGVKISEINERAKNGLVFRPNIEIGGEIIHILDSPELVGKDIFLTDPVQIFTVRLRKTTRAVAKQAMVHEFLRNPVWSRKFTGSSATELYEAIEEETKYFGRNVVVLATDVKPGDIAKPLGRKPSVENLKYFQDIVDKIAINGVVPIDISEAKRLLGDKLADEFVSNAGIYIVEEASYKRLLQKIDEYVYLSKEMQKGHKSLLARAFWATHSLLKSMLLASPRYHANNIYGLIQMSGELGIAPPQAVSRAAYALREIIIPIRNGAKQYSDLAEMLYTVDGRKILRSDIVKAYNTSRIAGNGMFAMLAAIRKKERTLLAKLPVFSTSAKILAANSALGSMVDDAFRYAAFESLILNGYSVKEAEKAVLEAFYNYRALTGAEKTFSTLIPFYAFARMNIPYQLKRIIQRPWRLNVWRARVTDEDLFYQNNIDAWSIPVWYGKTEEGRLVFALWRLGGRVLMADVQNIDTPKDIAQYFFGSLHPIFKIPFELTFNKQAFGILEDKTGLSFRKIYDPKKTTASKLAVYLEHVAEGLVRPYAEFRRAFLTKAYTNGRLEQDPKRITMPWLRNANEEYIAWETLILNKILSFASASVDFIDMQKREKNRVYELLNEAKDLKIQYNNLVMSKRSPEVIQKKANEIYNKINEIYKRIHRAKAKFRELKEVR